MAMKRKWCLLFAGTLLGLVMLSACGDSTTINNTYYTIENNTENVTESVGANQSEKADEGQASQPVSSSGQDTTQTIVSQTAEGPVQYFVKNTSGNLNIRSEAKHNSSLAGVVEDDSSTYLIYRGQSAPGLGSDGVTHTWYHVQIEGPNYSGAKEGWVRSDLVREINYDSDASALIKFTDDGVNIRSKPQHNSDLVCTVTSCYTKMYPLGGVENGLGSDGQTYQWIQVAVERDQNRIGWVRADLTDASIADAGYSVYVKDTSGNLNVRSLPQHDSDLVVSVVHADTFLYWDGVTDMGYGSDGVLHEWYHVQVSEIETGWVRSDLVKQIY